MKSVKLPLLARSANQGLAVFALTLWGGSINEPRNHKWDVLIRIAYDRHEFQDAVKLTVLPGELPPNCTAAFNGVDNNNARSLQSFLDDVRVELEMRLSRIHDNPEGIRKEPSKRARIERHWASRANAPIIYQDDPSNRRRGPFEAITRPDAPDLKVLRLAIHQREDKTRIIAAAELDEYHPHAGSERVQPFIHDRPPTRVSFAGAMDSMRRRHSLAASSETSVRFPTFITVGASPRFFST
jgi:hypothetical protein